MNAAKGDHPIHDTLSALFSAAGSGDIDSIRSLLSAGVDIDARNRRRETPVLRAAKEGQLHAVRYFIEAGADIDLQDETCLNPFLTGCISNNLGLVRLTVEAGADLNRLTRFGGNGLTPAAEKGHVDVVEYLLESTDINVNLTNTLGWTALIEAIILGDGGPTYQEVVHLLLGHGADPGLTDEWGVTPRELAERRGLTEVVDLIDAAALALEQ
ncbi:ankyrin repeat domain-containing protein [Paramicrobacterium chengjingii]|uniref:Ankyrin repeat domain-containing protein n=1 Tax=Paramicrobacterium chengjingii TaxID=2769067 RepID=A0ABX6YIC2_9MICO|nr:ankyrin repeat domain-containing protein [Microbacterium chengjingii]QPZ38087.1 ankyrin repeat domain-containing protein [Microbacterium chengjingii]